MAKFEQKLQELGLQESEISVSCKNLIKEYRMGVDYIPKLKETNQGGELDQDIESLTKELDNLDDKIVKKIVWFSENRELVEARKENLKKSKGRPKKNPTPTPPASASNPAPVPAPATPPAPATEPPTPPTPPPPPPPPPIDEPKKKKGFGFGTFLLLIGGTILGVSLLKNRN